MQADICFACFFFDRAYRTKCLIFNGKSDIFTEITIQSIVEKLSLKNQRCVYPGIKGKFIDPLPTE